MKQSSFASRPARSTSGGHVGVTPALRTARWSIVFALGAAFAGLLLPSAFASHTPAPTTVTIAGSLQSELGCPGDWDPACAVTHLTYDGNDEVWQGTFGLPSGSWEYKAALNNAWDENYGANAVSNGSNIPLLLAATESVKFYYDHESHWATDNQTSAIAVAAGSFQSELGCSGDWDPSCLRSWLQDPERDGTYEFMASLPAGDFETKVAIDESWDENYGAGGVANGPNIPFSVPTGGAEVCFSFNASSHMLTIESPCATNHAPTAVGDAYGANQGNQLSVPVAGGVLANDSDPDAGTTLTAVLESGPSHGTLALATDGSFVYTPVAVYSGSDSFSYRASDGSLASNLVTVTINVASLSTIINSQPKLTSGQKASLNNKLAAAATLFGQGKLNPACGKLSEFISQVSGLMPTKLSASTATVLINGANARKTYYGCPA